MNTKLVTIFALLALLASACAPLVAAQPLETATQPEVPTEMAETASTIAPVNVNNYATFSINVQDFSHPAESAAVLDKIITLHETYNVPVDIYLTGQMAEIYAAQYPELLERLKTSPVVAVSYHVRPPAPYYNQ